MMEYRKIINLLDNKPNQPTTFRIKNWVEMNDDSCGAYNTDSQIKFKTSMLRSSFCNYNDAYILVSGNITITAAESDDVAKRLDEINKGVIFKNCAPFTDSISKINNTQIDNENYINTIMSKCNLIEYNDNYSEISGNLWQYYRDDPNDMTESE